MYGKVSAFASSGVLADQCFGPHITNSVAKSLGCCFWLRVRQRINYCLGLYITRCVSECLDLQLCLSLMQGVEQCHGLDMAQSVTKFLALRLSKGVSQDDNSSSVYTLPTVLSNV